MKNLFIIFLISVCSFSSCKSEFGNNFKIMMDLKSEYNFNSVEMSWKENSATFTLQDIDHSDMSIDSLKSYSNKVDHYLINKFPEVDSLQTREYLFSGGAGFEIVQFSIDKKGLIKIIKEY